MSADTKDPINPKHYKMLIHERPVECIDVIEALDLDYSLGCALKYIWRFGRKSEGGLTRLQQAKQDLDKAHWYLNRSVQRRKTIRDNMGLLPKSIVQQGLYSDDQLVRFQARGLMWQILYRASHALETTQELIDVRPWIEEFFVLLDLHWNEDVLYSKAFKL